VTGKPAILHIDVSFSSDKDGVERYNRETYLETGMDWPENKACERIHFTNVIQLYFIRFSLESDEKSKELNGKQIASEETLESNTFVFG
jgi:hypothetical protein